MLFLPDVTSFYFKNIDGSKLADDFKPGQYLSIRINKEMFGGKIEYDMTRNYSMSCAPGLGYYRCSIKRENSGDLTGMVSNFMHDRIEVNDKIWVGWSHHKLILWVSQVKIKRTF